MSPLEKIQPYILVGTNEDSMALVCGKGNRCDLKVGI